jgi:hypothetical protein
VCPFVPSNFLFESVVSSILLVLLLQLHHLRDIQLQLLFMVT